ncbi:MAG: hypothetical protein EOO89_19680 [Pedobacter sp.]|nr:MAG: hypothetical protein EOO89_19680 [Pedobacter sp.]
MTLGFKTIMNDQPNYFVEKIWQGIFLLKNDEPVHTIYSKYLIEHTDRFNKEWDIITDEEIMPKLHTVRREKKQRWQKGMKIHFVINNRTTDRFQFAPVMECTGLQDIEINNGGNRSVIIDGREIEGDELELFSRNDGFSDSDALFDYFTSRYKGKLIHWAGILY